MCLLVVILLYSISFLPGKACFSLAIYSCIFCSLYLLVSWLFAHFLFFAFFSFLQFYFSSIPTSTFTCCMALHAVSFFCCMTFLFGQFYLCLYWPALAVWSSVEFCIIGPKHTAPWGIYLQGINCGEWPILWPKAYLYLYVCSKEADLLQRSIDLDRHNSYRANNNNNER